MEEKGGRESKEANQKQQDLDDNKGEEKKGRGIERKKSTEKGERK